MGRNLQLQDPLTPEQITRAILLRNRKQRGGGIMCWDQVARHMRMGSHRLMAQLDPAALEEDRRRRRESAAYRKPRVAATRGPAAFRVSEGALDDRDRRATIRAQMPAHVLMTGDPLPGQSALDKKLQSQRAGGALGADYIRISARA